VEKQDRKSLGCYKQRLRGDSVGSSEDQNADRNADSKDCAHKVSGRSLDSVGNWTRACSCYILVKSVVCILSVLKI
jgi:hypothetical protein